MTHDQQLTVGILHPGRMGAGIAAEARKNVDVLWCPTGRSEATAARAEAGRFTAVPTVAELVERSDVILSICPPMFAEAIAAEVGQYDVSGKDYVEANPVTRQQLDQITKALPGAAVIDGAIIGSVPGTGKKPALYVAGPSHATLMLAAIFSGTDVIVRRLGTEVGKASALKSAYSTYQKGARVLTVLAHALADEHASETKCSSWLRSAAAATSANPTTSPNWPPLPGAGHQTSPSQPPSSTPPGTLARL